jgi:ribosome-associated toxin RatA of RatAB toxin-antitoxin module
MQKFTASVLVNRSQQDVFDFLGDVANFQQWMPLMQSAAWTSSGEPGVGTTGCGIMKMAGREMELLLEVTRWDKPNRLGFKILNNPFPLESMEYVYRLEPEDGGTRLTLNGEIEMVRFMMFAEVWMGKMYVKSNRNELNTAKQLLEAG